MARDYLLIDKSGEEYLICEELNLMYALNEEVEVVEEDKKIKKDIPPYGACSDEDLYVSIVKKLYEVIDKINKD